MTIITVVVGVVVVGIVVVGVAVVCVLVVGVMVVVTAQESTSSITSGCKRKSYRWREGGKEGSLIH